MEKKPDSASGAASSLAMEKKPDLWYLRTEFRCWASLVLLCIGASFGQGPIMSFQILEPAMLDDGIFQCSAGATQESATRTLNTMFSMGIGASTIPTLVIGLFFDAIGPRTLAVTSFIIAALTFVVLGLALQFPCSFGSGWLWMSILVFVVSNAQSFAIYAYMWILPGHPFAVSALVEAAYVLSDVYGTAAGYLHAGSGLHSYTFFYLMAGLTLVSTLPALFLLPGREDFDAMREAVLETRRREQQQQQQQQAQSGTSTALSSGTKGGANESTPLKDGAVSKAADGVGGAVTAESKWRVQLRDAYILFVHTDTFGWAGVVMLTHVFVLYMQQMTLTLEQYAYYESLFDRATAVWLINTFGTIYACLAIPICLAFGVFTDYVGPRVSLVLIDLAALAFFAAAVFPEETMQLVAQVLLSGLCTLFYLLTPALGQRYAPPELFGTVYGAMSFFIGTGQVVLTPLGDALSAQISDDARFGFVLRLTFYTGLVAVLGVVNAVLWGRKPPPAAGSVSMDVVHAARAELAVPWA